MLKRVLLLTLLFLSFAQVQAEVVKLKATSFAYMTQTNYGWTDWTDWESCNILVVVNVDKDIITIYSNETQEYDIVEELDSETDSKSISYKFLCVNEDGNRCHVRLRVLDSGQMQLYIDFSDARWVYNVEER